MKKLRIAMLASNFIRIPPIKKFLKQGRAGAVESVVYDISEELIKRGHDVTLFASGNSKTSARLVSVTKKDSLSDRNTGVKNHIPYEHLLISKAYQMAAKGQFDIIHSHFDIRTAYYAPLVSIPTISTLHSPLDSYNNQQILKFYANTQYYVSISDSQRKPLPNLNYAATIYHGLSNLKKIKFSTKTGEYLLFIGRFREEKGVSEAIQVARKTDNKLILLGEPHSDQLEYWDKKIKPFIKGKITKRGFLPRKLVFQYARNAKALLFPIQWEEPFGLVMIEAMACGTPVIAFNRGSVSEIVDEGKTGFIVKPWNKQGKPNIEGLIAALRNIDKIDRMECRRHVQEKFTVERMVDDYEAAYKKALKDFKRAKK
ncbi:MAG: glycosyltransferase family 4 protein [DPANN group archaeon]|nr:glycosyltransferase family 4 protein [DPANN group archaeon]